MVDWREGWQNVRRGSDGDLFDFWDKCSHAHVTPNTSVKRCLK